MLKSKKAQAMTEFVIIIPVLLLLFTGIYQFTLLSIDKIKLAMVEREIMMFITEEDNKDDKWILFGKETAEKLGLEADKITVLAEKEQANAKMQSTGKLGPLSAFKGVEIRVVYDYELIPAFRAMTGKETIRLETKLVSASGGCFKVELKKGMSEAFEKVFGQGSSAGNMKDKYEQDEKDWVEAEKAKKAAEKGGK